MNQGVINLPLNSFAPALAERIVVTENSSSQGARET